MSGLVSAAEKAYATLLRHIVSGKLAAGTKLVEETLCEQLGLSRTPLREALLRLEREGLVERRPRYGCTVRRFDPQEIAEMFECRSILETKALALALDKIPSAEIDNALARLTRAREYFTQGDEESARSDALEADRMLHALVTRHCPNRRLGTIILDLQRQTAPFRDDRTYRSDALEGIIREREEILLALQRRDLPLAERLLVAHILQGISSGRA